MNTHKYINEVDSDSAEMYLFGEIGYDIDGNLFAKEIKFLEDVGVEELTIRINSPGGSVFEGMSIVSAIRSSKMDITLINEGVAASMAGIILASGKKGRRFSQRFAKAMLHEPSIAGKKVADIKDKDLKKGLESIREMLIEILSDTTNMDAESIDKMFETGDTWVNAKKAKKMGLIDSIISVKNELQINQTATSDQILELVTAYYKPNNINKMELLINHFDLSEASEQEILDKVKEIEDKASLLESEKETLSNDLTKSNEDLKESEDKLTKITDEVEAIKAEKIVVESEVENLKKEIEEKNAELAGNLVDSYIREGKFKASERKALVEKCIADSESFKAIANAFSGGVESLNTIQNDPKPDEKTYKELERENPVELKRIRDEEPERFAELLKAAYGV